MPCSCCGSSYCWTFSGLSIIGCLAERHVVECVPDAYETFHQLVLCLVLRFLFKPIGQIFSIEQQIVQGQFLQHRKRVYLIPHPKHHLYVNNGHIHVFVNRLDYQKKSPRFPIPSFCSAPQCAHFSYWNTSLSFSMKLVVI